MVEYIAFLRGVNVAGKWVKMEDVRKHMSSAGFENVRTYIQSGNVLFDSPNKDVTTVQDKVAKVISKTAGSETHVVVIPRVELRVLLQSNPFKKITTKSEDKKSVIFLVKEPKNPLLPLISTKKDVEVFYYRNRMAVAISHRQNGSYTYPTALLESKWSVPATTRFWHTLENMLEEMK